MQDFVALAEAYRRNHPEICLSAEIAKDIRQAANSFRDLCGHLAEASMRRRASLAAIHAAKHLRVKCGSFAARRYAEKRGASALMCQIAEEFEERRSHKCK